MAAAVNASPMDAIQTAVHARLTDTLDAPVLDHVPESQDKPYVTLGEGTAVPYNTQQTFGHNCTITLHVYSERRWFRQANDLAGEAAAALDRRPLDLGEDWHTVGVALERIMPARDPDPEIRHVAVRIRIRTEHRPEEAS